MQEFLRDIVQGITKFEYNTIVAGFLGGVVFVTITKNLTKAQMYASVFVGLLTAYYLTPLFTAIGTKYLSLEFTSKMEGGVGFILGLSALYLLPAIIRKLTSKVGE